MREQSAPVIGKGFFDVATRQMGRPSLGFIHQIRHFTIPDEMEAAVTEVQRMSGLSRVAIARQALAEYLVGAGVLDERALPATATTRPNTGGN